MNHGHTAQSLRTFELAVRRSWEEGNLPTLLHLAGGEEEHLLEIFDKAGDTDWIFGNHRSHYLALLAGMTEQEVWDAIHRGDSMFLYSRECRFYSSAILAGCCAIATGIAWANKQAGNGSHVHVFIGDGAEESGHFYESVLYSEGHRLPITFWILDNDRQVDTNKLTRRGMPFGILDSCDCVQRRCYTPDFPHGGSGCKTIIEFKNKTPQWGQQPPPPL